MRSKKSAPAIGGTIRRSMKDGGISRSHLTTRGSARSSIVAGGMTPVLLRAAGGALLAAMAAAASFLPLAEASADSPAWMLHPVDGASEPGTQLSYCTSLSTDETMPEDETARWTPETVFFHVVDGCGTEVTPPPAPASGIEVHVDQKAALVESINQRGRQAPAVLADLQPRGRRALRPVWIHCRHGGDPAGVHVLRQKSAYLGDKPPDRERGAAALEPVPARRRQGTAAPSGVRVRLVQRPQRPLLRGDRRRPFPRWGKSPSSGRCFRKRGGWSRMKRSLTTAGARWDPWAE